MRFGWKVLRITMKCCYSNKTWEAFIPALKMDKIEYIATLPTIWIKMVNSKGNPCQYGTLVDSMWTAEFKRGRQKMNPPAFRCQHTEKHWLWAPTGDKRWTIRFSYWHRHESVGFFLTKEMERFKSSQDWRCVQKTGLFLKQIECWIHHFETKKPGNSPWNSHGRCICWESDGFGCLGS